MDTLSLLRAGQLAGSRRLDLSCGLKEFPVEIFDLADSLEILNLSGNALSSLPADLGRLHKLRILFCSDNQFTEVPEVLGQSPQLEMVGFKANRIHSVPAAALTAALAQRGGQLNSIAWHSLALQHKLGEGASGVIYQARWQRAAASKDVAVKLFKGALTSDGLPHSEMAACISAGAHPNLIGVDG